MKDVVGVALVYLVGAILTVAAHPAILFGHAEPGGLRITTYNAERLRPNSLDNTTATTIHRLAQDASVLALQEVQGDKAALDTALRRATPPNHSRAISPALGTTPYYTERYALIYDDSVSLSNVSVDRSIAINRPPLTADLAYKNQSYKLFTVHTDPGTASEEIQALHQATKDTPKALTLGDFNADCSYHDPGTHPEASWLVSADADTTTTGTDCAYDRFLAGSEAARDHQTTSVLDTPSAVSNHRAVRATFTT